MKTGSKLRDKSPSGADTANPENTVYSIKRFMGHRYDEVTEEMKRVPYKIMRSASTRLCRNLWKVYSPPEVSAMILQKLKSAAEDFLGEKVTKAVITVPAYFSDSQRQVIMLPAKSQVSSVAHHQRADCGSARLWPRCQERRNDRSL